MRQCKLLLLTNQLIPYHGLRTPNEAFFREIPELLGLGRQSRQVDSGTFGGILGQTTGTHFGTMSSLSMLFINQRLFLL